jgi:ankyrin repeat protein
VVERWILLLLRGCRGHSLFVSLECAADGKVRDKYDAILLHSASYYGKFEMAQVLLDNHVNVNVKSHLAETALHAVSRGKDNSQEGVRVARLLLERGGDVDAENDDRRTPLHAASYYGRPDIAQLLLDHGANTNAEDMFFRKPLHQVSCGVYESQESGVHVAKLLLEHGLDVNISDKYLWTPLHLASYTPRPKIVEVLLDHGAEVDAKNDQGETPLHLVSRIKYDPQDVYVAQLLLDNGADANAKRNDYCTPLHGVAFSGRSEIVRVLLDHGATTNAEDRFLRTPLHTVSLGQYESQEGGVRTAQLLLERSVDMNARDKNNETPLHLASSSGKPEIVRVLLEHATVKNDQDPSHLGIEGDS